MNQEIQAVVDINNAPSGMSDQLENEDLKKKEQKIEADIVQPEEQQGQAEQEQNAEEEAAGMDAEEDGYGEEEMVDQYEGLIDQYGDMGYDDIGYDICQAPKRSHSLQNEQTDINNLLEIILEEANDINKYTTFGQDWSLIYYSACGWKKEICQEFIGTEEKHKKIINYTPDFIDTQGVVQIGECMLCCEENKTIVRNICGEDFCQDCWISQIKERLKSYYTDPFPPCINDCCPIKISPKICFELGTVDPELKKSFETVLCRSYSTYNDSVKICKGMEGKDCQRVFRINKMLAMIVCDTCGNIVCPRCGNEAHGAAYCYEINNWRKITEESIQFVEMLNYKICPNCKEAVERKSGCNSIVCPCKQQFCFVCGDKWLPSHTQHGDTTCPRFKQIEALKNEQKVKKENSEAYFLKIEDRKSKLEQYHKMRLAVNTFKDNLDEYIKILKSEYPFYESELCFLKDLCIFQMKAIAYMRGEVLALYFRPNELRESQNIMLNDVIKKVDNFLYELVDKQLKAHERVANMPFKEEKLLFPENREAFVEKFREFKKNAHTVIESGQKLMLYE